MRLLVLGGTAFVGKHIVDAAVAGGHDVTLFNRGQTNAGVFEALPRRSGDRATGDLESLKTGEWDAVIDVTAYVPRQVRQMTAALDGRVGKYALVSTVSVYADTATVGGDETTPLAEHPDPDSEADADRYYGPLKVLCEQAAVEAFPDALIIRPGVVVGTLDKSERFGYWVRRVAAGGRILCPPRAEQPVQVVHAADQAAFLIRLVEEGTSGVFDTVGDTVTFSAMLATCAEVAGVDLDAAWAPQDVLRSQKVALPLSLPASGSWDGMFTRSGERARAAGFANRPLLETAREVLAFERDRDPATVRGLSATQEDEVLSTF